MAYRVRVMGKPKTRNHSRQRHEFYSWSGTDKPRERPKGESRVPRPAPGRSRKTSSPGLRISHAQSCLQLGWRRWLHTTGDKGERFESESPGKGGAQFQGRGVPACTPPPEEHFGSRDFGLHFLLM